MGRSFKKLKPKSMILIPARAGTSNISRQNLRLVGNKPLMYYVIKSALQITPYVYVSTDSYEIKEICPELKNRWIHNSPETTPSSESRV